MQEEFLESQLLGYQAIGISVDAAAGLEPSFLDIGAQDGLVAHYPYHLINGISLRHQVLGEDEEAEEGYARQFAIC
jgi:hypothetical protein